MVIGQLINYCGERLKSYSMFIKYKHIMFYAKLNSRKTYDFLQIFQGFPGFPGSKVFLAQMVKNLSAMLETRIQSLRQEESLKKGMAAHCSILAWRILWTEEPGWPQSTGSQSQTQLSD